MGGAGKSGRDVSKLLLRSKCCSVRENPSSGVTLPVNRLWDKLRDRSLGAYPKP